MDDQPFLTPLGELGVLDRGRSRHRPRYAHHLYGGKYPFIQTGDIKSSGGRITSFSQTYSEAGLEQSRLWGKGTLCITIAANIAETGILDFPACFPDSVVGFLANQDLCDTRYIEYTFRHLRQKIQGDASGSVQDNINLEYLRNLPVPIWSLDKQKAIAHILGTLDDKIELNRKTNETLEGIAKALFKSWFVDFDPVRAKAEGRSTRLPDEISELFPDSFEESELGDIPSGWTVDSFTSRFNVLGGGTPKTSVEGFWNGDLPWFSVVDAPNDSDCWVVDTQKEITSLGLESCSSDLLRTGTTIISARGTVGKVCLVGRPMAMNQSCYALQSKRGQQDVFCYYSTKEIVEILKARSHGSVFSTITRDTLNGVDVCFPNHLIVNAFEELSRPVLERIKLNVDESRTLASTRDALLPKLISGELTVPDAEKILEEVGI